MSKAVRSCALSPQHHSTLYEGVRKAIDTWRDEAAIAEFTDDEALESLTRFVMGGVAATLEAHGLAVTTTSKGK